MSDSTGAHQESTALDIAGPQNQGWTKDGKPVLMTAPQPFKKASPRYYTCTQMHHSMIRTDGKLIHFLFGTVKTDDLNTHRYLDQEIANGNVFIRPSNKMEIDAYNMRTDPKGTIANEIRPEMEAQISNQLSLDLKKALQEKVANGTLSLTDEQIAELTDGMKRVPDGAGKLSGVDPATVDPGITSGTAKLRELSASRGAQLGGITGTDKLAGAAGGL